MKKTLFTVLISLFCGSGAFAVDKVVGIRTGDNTTFNKISVSSFTATSLSAYSTSRGALTCVNDDTSVTLWISTSSAMAVAAGTAAYPIYPRNTFEILNNTSIFGLADAGQPAVNVYCATEN